MNPNTQKSETHESTADATDANAAAEATRRTQATGHADRAWPDSNPINPNPPTDATIVEDESEDGGPVVIRSSDPDLNPPRAPVNPFPTERTPEIDPPVK